MKPALPLLDRGRFESPVSIPRHVKLDRADFGDPRLRGSRDFVERSRGSYVVGLGVNADLVVAAANVLDERVTANLNRCGPVPF